MKEMFKYDVVILGGLGHVGLPLGIVLANTGLKVCLEDVNLESVKIVESGKMPFIEYGAEPMLSKVLSEGTLKVSTNIQDASQGKYLIIAIGTPVDEYLNPKTNKFLKFFDTIKPYIKKEQTIIIRSTVSPNTCAQLERVFTSEEGWKISYCPERIVQGYSIKELHELPQIVAGTSEAAQESAAQLFSRISPKIIRTTIAEAELAKLFSNAWRYIQFAATNQFYMISENFGVDYSKVRYALTEGYGRIANLPSPGFTAGPCLLKDTMQLASVDPANFLMGHSAMMINEGLPNFIIEKIRQKFNLSQSTVGILGMSFKAEVDDIRDSLSFKISKILKFNGAKVLMTDEFAKNSAFVPKEEVLRDSDVIILGVPHKAYKELNIPKHIYVVDIWDFLPK